MVVSLTTLTKIHRFACFARKWAALASSCEYIGVLSWTTGIHTALGIRIEKKIDSTSQTRILAILTCLTDSQVALLAFLRTGVGKGAIRTYGKASKAECLKEIISDAFRALRYRSTLQAWINALLALLGNLVCKSSRRAG